MALTIVPLFLFSQKNKKSELSSIDSKFTSINRLENQMIYVYKHERLSPIWYIALNLIVPFGLGSYVQGDTVLAIIQTIFTCSFFLFLLSIIIGFVAPIVYEKNYENKVMQTMGFAFKLQHLLEREDYCLALKIDI